MQIRVVRGEARIHYTVLVLAALLWCATGCVENVRDDRDGEKWTDDPVLCCQCKCFGERCDTLDTPTVTFLHELYIDDMDRGETCPSWCRDLCESYRCDTLFATEVSHSRCTLEGLR